MQCTPETVLPQVTVMLDFLARPQLPKLCVFSALSNISAVGGGIWGNSDLFPVLVMEKEAGGRWLPQSWKDNRMQFITHLVSCSCYKGLYHKMLICLWLDFKASIFVGGVCVCNFFQFHIVFRSKRNGKFPV